MKPRRELTAALIVYRKNRLNHRLRFGNPVLDIRLDWRRRLVGFEPGSVFGYIRWRADKYGMQDWRLFVLRSVYGGSITSVPGVYPGAEILLSSRGKTKTQRALTALDALEKSSNGLALISPSYWRHLHNRLACGLPTHDYSALQMKTKQEEMT